MNEYAAVLASDGSIAVTSGYETARAKELVAVSPENVGILDPNESCDETPESSVRCLKGISLSGGKVLTDAALIPRDMIC